MWCSALEQNPESQPESACQLDETRTHILRFCTTKDPSQDEEGYRPNALQTNRAEQVTEAQHADVVTAADGAVHEGEGTPAGGM